MKVGAPGDMRPDAPAPSLIQRKIERVYSRELVNAGNSITGAESAFC